MDELNTYLQERSLVRAVNKILSLFYLLLLLLYSLIEFKLIYKKVKPLTFWLENKDKYPILSQIARKYLQIPATSASSERFFSQGALIINKIRNKLSKETFEQIICLKSWGVFKELNKEEREELVNEVENDFFIPE